MSARYNGLADWYDARFVTGAPRHQPGMPALHGPSELTLEHFEEPDEMPVPHSLALKARRN